MPNAWSMIDSSFPTFRGDESYKDQVQALQDYIYLLVEELKYQLANLKTNNWNANALEKFQKDTTAETDQQVSLLAEQLTNLVNRMTALNGNLSQLTGQVQETEAEISQLWEGLELLGGDLDELNQIIQRDGSGITIGASGKELNIVGNIYINGIALNTITGGTGQVGGN